MVSAEYEMRAFGRYLRVCLPVKGVVRLELDICEGCREWFGIKGIGCLRLCGCCCYVFHVALVMPRWHIEGMVG